MDQAAQVDVHALNQKVVALEKVVAVLQREVKDLKKKVGLPYAQNR